VDEGIFRILSIDGGGLRGIFPAHILKCISERLDVDLQQSFDFIAGTSTGSIIAAGIAVGKSPAEIVDLYKEYGSAIFSSEKKSFFPKKIRRGIHSAYEKDELESVLEKAFGDVRLGEIKVPLLIPATDIGHGSVHVFKSSYSPEFTRDKTVLLRDAVLASCSAPVYFDPTKLDSYLLADGGVWANNPALAALIDTKHRLGINLERVSMLSLGTGHSRTAYGVNTDRNWGLLTGWKNLDFIDFLLSLQAQSTTNYLKLMISKEQLIRLNFETDKPIPLDKIDVLDDLISRADREFTHCSANLMAFFGK
jgi:patatin-like phospholipase/acyl hydrolase